MEPLVVVAYPGVQPIDVVGPYETFAAANRALVRRGEPPAYDLSIVGTEPTIASTSGVRLAVDPLPEVTGGTLLLPGGIGANDPARTGLLDWLRGVRPDRLVLVCTGALIAAAAGIIDGRTVTTHWMDADILARRHPEVHVEADPVWLRDGDVWSSGGVTAGLDLAVAIVAEDCGAAIGQEVARWLVMYVHRPGNQSQFAAPVWLERATDDRIRAVERRLANAPAEAHSVDSLAREAGMSPRHFQRVFAKETGRPVGAYLAELRVTTAQRLLTQTDHPAPTVARLAGFGSAESMRRTFVERLGTAPSAYRRRFTPTSTPREVRA